MSQGGKAILSENVTTGKFPTVQWMYIRASLTRINRLLKEERHEVWRMTCCRGHREWMEDCRG